MVKDTEFKYCDECEEILLEEDNVYEGICNECGGHQEHGVKWSCNECEHIWYGGHFETYIECPECDSEDMGHW